MNCLRCGLPMYRVVGEDGSPKATCTGCSQWVDCARCSNPACGDTKCLACYNNARTGVARRPAVEPLLPQDEDVQ